jgi:hypothetical protein
MPAIPSARFVIFEGRRRRIARRKIPVGTIRYSHSLTAA